MNSPAFTLLMTVAGVAGSPRLPARPENGGMSGRELLDRSFDLTGPHSPETQRYQMESKMMSHGPDGAIVKTDIYRLRLECRPAAPAGGAADRWTCLEFTIELAGSPPVSIPSLSGWSYPFSRVAQTQ